MTNDTSTLNGALQELGETMAANLVAQGVTGASASDGLTTLADKILDIQTGGGSCYHIEFNEASYTASGGSATLELTLQSNYAPLSGATVSVTGSDSSSYTCTTNSNGVGTVTVTGVTSETTFTASYNNVSDTCTVTVSNVLFFDDATSNHTDWYSTTNFTNATLSYGTGYYQMKMNANAIRDLWIKDLTVSNNVKITVDLKITTTTNTQCGLLVMNSSKNKGVTAFYEYQSSKSGYAFSTVTQVNDHGNKIKTDTYLSQSQLNNWVTQELVIYGSSIVYKLYDSNSNLLATYSTTYSDLGSTGNVVGLMMSYNNSMICQFKNLKVEAL